MEEVEWSIKLEFDDIKAMFDPVVERIIQLMNSQLNLCNDCSALFLIGGFGASNYLQSRIKQEFSSRVRIIFIPILPDTVIMEGGENIN
jgi:hypothetical protein